MTGKEIYDRFNQGFRPVVTVKELGEYNEEAHCDSDMRGEVVSATVHEPCFEGDQGYVIVVVDFSDYVDYNKQFAIANFKEKGRDDLTWFETKLWENNKKNTIYMPVGQQNVLEIASSVKQLLLDAWQKEAPTVNYMTWLEERVSKTL